VATALLKAIAKGERIQNQRKSSFSGVPLQPTFSARGEDAPARYPPLRSGTVKEPFGFVEKSQTKKRATVGGRVDDSLESGLQGLRKGGERVYLETFVDVVAELKEGWAKP